MDAVLPAWFTALFLTQVIELPIAACMLRETPVLRRLGTVFLLNVLTNPLLNLALSRIVRHAGRPILAYLLVFGIGECLAWGAEAAGIRYALQQSWPRSLAASAAMNGTSALLGLLICF